FTSRSASRSQANRKTIARTRLADHLRPPRLLLPARAELAHPVRLPLAPPKLALFAHPSLALRLSAQFNPHSCRRSPSLAQLTFCARRAFHAHFPCRPPVTRAAALKVLCIIGPSARPPSADHHGSIHAA